MFVCILPLMMMMVLSVTVQVTKTSNVSWITTVTVAHSKKMHEDSASVLKHKESFDQHQLRLGEYIQASGSEGIQSSSSKNSSYGTPSG